MSDRKNRDVGRKKAWRCSCERCRPTLAARRLKAVEKDRSDDDYDVSSSLIKTMERLHRLGLVSDEDLEKMKRIGGEPCSQ